MAGDDYEPAWERARPRRHWLRTSLIALGLALVGAAMIAIART